MFYATVETDVGDVLNVLHFEGRVGGKGILSFLTGLSWYCSKTEVKADMQRWFSALEAYAKEPVCHSTQLLLQSFYSGDWDYNEDEYEWLLHRTHDTTTTEESFRETVRQIRQKWVDLERLRAEVTQLIRALIGAKLGAAWWHEPGATNADLQALSQTLSLAAERGAEKVRIKFT
jgi:glycine/D-amino acid oxidase-like deaminating enzyme